MPVTKTDATAQPILQRSLDLMETASCWMRKAAKKAHIVGLQGEKRRLRYLSREARNLVDWIEHSAYDLFKLDTCGQSGTIDVKDLVCPMSTMNGIIEKLWKVYNEAHQVANDLVIAKYRSFASPIYKYTDELICILSELQRAQTEYERAEYEYHHISRYQVGYWNVHDEYEKMEETQGYSDHK